MSSGALILDETESILLVKPNYREGWLIPGGIVESDESPREACSRELREELGFKLTVSELLCVDYNPSTTDSTESVHFVFFGGLISAEKINEIQLCEKELSESNFFGLENSLSLVNDRLSRRLRKAFQAYKNSTVLYLENGT